MDLYTKTSYQLSRQLTLRYSTSFGKSTQQFSKSIQPHIFAIYGLVRIADEIVDTYTGDDKAAQLDALERETYATLETGYSANPIVHAFAQTARDYAITEELIAPFFKSMRLDLAPQTYTDELYRTYIYGSAEVIGLMCLKVFTHNSPSLYDQLLPGACALGAAYQKVNFLRDIASDHHDRGRVYFPGATFESFSEHEKEAIIADIKSDFDKAEPAVRQLPLEARRAVKLSYLYYRELLAQLEQTPAETIKKRRIRVPDVKKLTLLMRNTMRKV